MGMSTIAAHIIMFLLLFNVLYTSYTLFESYTENNHASTQVTRDLALERLDSSLKILNITYNDTDNVTTVLIENSGTLLLHKDKMDVFINNFRLQRGNLNWSLSYHRGNNGILWEPMAVYELNVTHGFQPGFNTVQMITEYGTSATSSITI